MIKTSLLVTCASVAMVAHAHDVVVLKDTRRYVPFTESVSGPVGCAMPKEADHPNLDDQNECRINRSKLVTSGELLTRNGASGVCSRAVYSGGTKRLGGGSSGDVVPDQSMHEETFKCDASGARTG